MIFFGMGCVGVNWFRELIPSRRRQRTPTMDFRGYVYFSSASPRSSDTPTGFSKFSSRLSSTPGTVDSVCLPWLSLVVTVFVTSYMLIFVSPR